MWTDTNINAEKRNIPTFKLFSYLIPFAMSTADMFLKHDIGFRKRTTKGIFIKIDAPQVIAQIAAQISCPTLCIGGFSAFS